jgi:hypothetical protein
MFSKDYLNPSYSQILFDKNELVVHTIRKKYNIEIDPFEGEKELTIKLK